MSTLLRGSTGAEVRSLQHALNARPYINLIEDGIFGPLTEMAVRNFQRRVHLIEDGVVGPRTDALLWTRVVFADAILRVPVGNPPPVTFVRPTGPTGPITQGAPAAPSTGAGIVQQVGVGGQIALAPWLLRPMPAPGTPSAPIWSGLISYALVYRTASSGPHVEFALNPQFLVNSRVQTTDPRWGLQLNGQVMFADLVAPGRWHLISPFLQGSGTLGFGPGPSFGGGFAIGNQVAFDLVPDRLQINLQTGVAAQWANIGTPNASFSVLGQGALGATLQF
jgi:peptidoglycan hydrolase-like protein with peptidoglycan-binding domain